jgi:recombination protein RecR
MPEALKQLINIISLLPWIWEKSANRLAFFLLNSNKNYIEKFSQSLLDIKQKVWKCNVCHALVDSWKDKCNICSNPSRNKKQIAIVEEYLDLLTIEQTWIFNWTYHILGWAISPISWVFIWDLNFETLFERIFNLDWEIELILATNPNIEWEATATYIKEEIQKRWLSIRVKITRISRWISAGYIEYADNISIINSIKERRDY